MIKLNTPYWHSPTYVGIYYCRHGSRVIGSEFGMMGNYIYATSDMWLDDDKKKEADVQISEQELADGRRGCLKMVFTTGAEYL